MAVTVADLVEPAGPINPAIVWPDVPADEVTATLEGYLAAGRRKTVGWSDPDLRDQGALKWAEYRCKDAWYGRLVGLPSTMEKAGEGSQSYLVTQIQMVKDDRDAVLAEFEALELEDSGEEEAEETFTTIRSLFDG